MEKGFVNDFVFCAVMSRDKKKFKRVIELALGIEIGNITYIKDQETIAVFLKRKKSRLDVYAEDDANRAFDLEMQTNRSIGPAIREELAKRSRYYRGMIDHMVLNEREDYKTIKDNYVVFICTADPFRRGLGRYRFEMRCREDETLGLEDGSVVVFLNAGSDDESLSSGLRNLLRYIKTGIPCDEFTSSLQDDVETLEKDPEWREEMRTLEDLIREESEERVQEAKAEGMEVMLELINGQITVEEAAKRLDIPAEELKARIKKQQ